MVERSKTRLCSRSHAGIAGSNPAVGTDVCCVCYSIRTKGKARKKQDKAVQIKYIERTKKNPTRGMDVVTCLLSGRGLCDGLIIRPEESYRLWLCEIK